MSHPIATSTVARTGPQPGTIEWAATQMPVLGAIRKRFEKEHPLAGAKVAILFHLTKEVANLALAAREAGAEVLLMPSKIATVEPAALDGLRAAGLEVLASPSVGDASAHLTQVLSFAPDVAVDNAELFSLWHRSDAPPEIKGMSIHSRSACLIVDDYWAQHRSLRFPVVEIGSSNIKLELESTLGTGQSVIDALIRVTGVQLSGKRIAVVGFGNVGSGIARAARGLGARVLIVQNSAYRALKAVMDGYDVVPLHSAAQGADILITATGTKGVLTSRHFPLLRDGVFIGNVGRSREEIDVAALERDATSVQLVDHNITAYILNDRRIYLMGGGHQFNHVAGGANSSELMDLSLALHALTIEHIWRAPQLSREVHPVQESILDEVARLKLGQLGIEFASE
jgi:adenosylhomocysteinase